MTPGTSPRPLETLFMRWTEAAKGIYGALARLQGWLRRFRLEGPELGRAAAVLYLAGLGIVLTTAVARPGRRRRGYDRRLSGMAPGVPGIWQPGPRPRC